MAIFDSFSSGYKGGANQDWLRAAAGGSHESFLLAKAEILVSQNAAILEDENYQYLDFGCGMGDFVHILKSLGAKSQIIGCDVSKGMIDEGQRRHAGSRAQAKLMHIPETGPIPFADASFNAVSAICVFHHVLPESRAFYTKELHRILKPNGELFIFEHNPWNPATRWIIRNDPADAEAQLLSALETTALMKDSGFVSTQSGHCLFLPPRIRLFRRLERFLRWIPMGSQYFVRGTRGGLQGTDK